MSTSPDGGRGKCAHPDCDQDSCGASVNGAEICVEHIDWAMGKAFAPIHRFEEIFGTPDNAPVEREIANLGKCADCGEPAETVWDKTDPPINVCYGCAYGRAGWEE